MDSNADKHPSPVSVPAGRAEELKRGGKVLVMPGSAEDKRSVRLQRKQKLSSPDAPFLLLVLTILILGLVMVFSSSYELARADNLSGTAFIADQAMFAVGGVAAMIAIMFVDYRRYKAFAAILLVITFLLMLAVALFGSTSGGAKRWLNIGFSFQPSEVHKFALILFFAWFGAKYHDRMKTFKLGILPYLGIVALTAFFMYLQSHLSGLILMLTTVTIIIFVAGASFWKLAIIGGTGIGGLLAYSLVGDNMSHVMPRIQSWLDPFADARGVGYQVIQSLYAISSGGLFGLGLGQSRQKLLYLPEAPNDFIFSVTCEELGFVGAALIMLLYALLIVRGFYIASKAKDRFGSLLVTGIISLVAIQTILNIAVVTNTIPVTGMSLPFFSYGGTSLMTLLGEMGIVLSVSRHIPAPKRG